jgi:hypothetical protein
MDKSLQKPKIHLLDTPLAKITNITAINLILGRNGAGKSRFLRNLEDNLVRSDDYYVRYISPERAGVFKRQGHVDTNMEGNVDWLRNVRARNQSDNFKAASASLLREVEILYLRRLQDTVTIRNDLGRSFKTDRLDKINSLLTNIYLSQEKSNFVFRAHDDSIIQPDQISSGESEVVSLAAEIIYFFETVDSSKFNVLLLDEPDVHLHPDLQARLAKFILSMIDDIDLDTKSSVAICLATHSTPLVCALAPSQYTSIGNKNFDQNEIVQTPASDHLKKVAPFFGHPLSLSLSNDALLILEGEDDERVWQQAARSAQGRIRVFPVLASSVDQQSDLENFCAQMLKSLYDNPIGYSLRDGDGKIEKLTPVEPIMRFRLNCYAIENLLLTDEGLAILKTNWNEFKQKATEWLNKNPEHRDVEFIRELICDHDRSQHKKIKQVRQLICSIADSLKPWEVVVGQALGTIKIPTEIATSEVVPTSLLNFVGLDAVQHLLDRD